MHKQGAFCHFIGNTLKWDPCKCNDIKLNMEEILYEKTVLSGGHFLNFSFQNLQTIYIIWSHISHLDKLLMKI